MRRDLRVNVCRVLVTGPVDRQSGALRVFVHLVAGAVAQLDQIERFIDLPAAGAAAVRLRSVVVIA
jgi:hypothetical protein